MLREEGFTKIEFFDNTLELELNSGAEAGNFISPIKEVAKLKGKKEYDYVLDSLTTQAQEILNQSNRLIFGFKIVKAYKTFN